MVQLKCLHFSGILAVNCLLQDILKNRVNIFHGLLILMVILQFISAVWVVLNKIRAIMKRHLIITNQAYLIKNNYTDVLNNLALICQLIGKNEESLKWYQRT